MQSILNFISKKVPAISAEYKIERRMDRYNKAYYTITYADISMSPEIATGFKRMYHYAEISLVETGYGVRLSLKWETLQGGTNGVTIFNEFLEN